MNTDAEKLVLLIAPLMLNMNINLFIAETPIFYPDSSSYVYNPAKVKYTTSNETQSPTINLFKRNGHYDVVYMRTFSENHFDYLSIYKYTDSDYEKFNRVNGYIIKEEGDKCNECHQEGEGFIRIKFPDIHGVICKNCLVIHVTEIMEQRVKYFLSELYFNLECKL